MAARPGGVEVAMVGGRTHPTHKLHGVYVADWEAGCDIAAILRYKIRYVRLSSRETGCTCKTVNIDKSCVHLKLTHPL